MRVLLIDNFDSFVYNLYQYVGELGAEIIVRRNKITVAEVKKFKPEKIIISPGPGTPEEAGSCIKIIREFAGEVPILGVCLGHQAIGVAFGGIVARAGTLMHGKTSTITHDGKSIYAGVKNPFIAARYHSLAIQKEKFPKALEITATSEDGIIMGVRHKEHIIEGVQFHPESILTNEGKKIIKNFLEL